VLYAVLLAFAVVVVWEKFNQAESEVAKEAGAAATVFRLSQGVDPERGAAIREAAYVAVDASGTFSETKRQAGLLRMLQAGVIVSDYASLMVEILKDNARPEAGAVYGVMDMPWAKLVGQIAHAYGK